MKLQLLFIIVLSIFIFPENSYSWARNCNPAEMKNILAKANSRKSTVEIRCSFVLNKNDRITKRLVFLGDRGSNVRIDCNDGVIDGRKGNFNFPGNDMIQIRSRKMTASNGATVYTRPSNIHIRECIVHGSIRVFGMSQNGEGADNRASSRRQGHTQRSQLAAPTKITFDRMKIFGQGRIPLYLSPGVTWTRLINSIVAGRSDSVAIYFDAESAHNTLKNNIIQTTLKKRELIALDGSASNRIINNRFSSLQNGGIYLYRNCGEGGAVRHQKPRNNFISNNSFFYRRYNGRKASIYLGSRNGNRNYCGDDRGFRFGSSVSNKDFAHNNIILRNQIYKFSPKKMIRSKVKNDLKLNTVLENIKVKKRIARRSACYLRNAYPKPIIEHGMTNYFFRNRSGRKYCNGFKYRCNDGEITVIKHRCTGPIGRARD